VIQFLPEIPVCCETDCSLANTSDSCYMPK